MPPETETSTKIRVVDSASIILVIFLGIAGCFFARSVLIQLVCSFFLFFLLDPIVEWTVARHIPRKISATFLVLLMVTMTLGTVWMSYGALATIAQEMPQYTGKIKKTLSTLIGQAEQIQKSTSGILPTATPKDDVQKVEIQGKFSGNDGQAVLQGVGSVFEVFAAVILVPILLLFLLLEKKKLSTALEKAISPSFNRSFAGKEFSEMTRGFFVGNFVVGLVTAVGFYGIFSYLKLENCLFLSLLAGFMNLVPMIGALLGGVVPMLQAFLQFDHLGPAVTIFFSSIFLHFFVANFIIPKLVGSRINVNATAATIGLIFWGWLWGPIGLLLAVPLTASIRIFLASKKSTLSLAALIADD